MRNYFRYLSDNLSVTVYPSQTGVIPYRVEMKPTSKVDSYFTTIYHGSIYSTGEPVKIHLNDIIETNMDSFGWFKDRTISTTNEQAEVIQRTYVDVRVVLEQGSGEEFYWLSDIINGYLNPNMEHEFKFDVDGTVYVRSMTDFGYKVVPHIPYNTRSWADENMVVNFNLPVKLFVNNDVDNIRLQIKNENGNTMLDAGRDSLPYPIMGVNITDSLLKLGAPIDKEGYTLNAVFDGDETPLAVIDYEPAEYYLMWINRYGATQCQPFCRKNTLNETVSTNHIGSLIGENVVASKSVDYTWTLNSHWLTYDEHGEFESLLISKYVWLYDVKKGWFYPVNVTDGAWSYKNPKNNKRPFNLTVNVKLSQTQNINY